MFVEGKTIVCQHKMLVGQLQLDLYPVLGRGVVSVLQQFEEHALLARVEILTYFFEQVGHTRVGVGTGVLFEGERHGLLVGIGHFRDVVRHHTEQIGRTFL